MQYQYREYTQVPLTTDEIRQTLKRLGMSARQLLRARDAARAGLTGGEPEEELIVSMERNPTLIQRPIGILGNRAVLGRPPEKLLELIREEDSS